MPYSEDTHKLHFVIFQDKISCLIFYESKTRHMCTHSHCSYSIQNRHSHGEPWATFSAAEGEILIQSDLLTKKIELLKEDREVTGALETPPPIFFFGGE